MIPFFPYPSAESFDEEIFAPGWNVPFAMGIVSSEFSRILTFMDQVHRDCKLGREALHGSLGRGWQVKERIAVVVAGAEIVRVEDVDVGCIRRSPGIVSL